MDVLVHRPMLPDVRTRLERVIAMTDNRTTELTATDRLRAMLDERGVEWVEGQENPDLFTGWHASNGEKAAVHETHGKLYLVVNGIEPEQAIAATLGSEQEKALEELVRDMSAALIHDNCYRWCEPNEPCNLITDGRCQYRERMKELGIEVIDE